MKKFCVWRLIVGLVVFCGIHGFSVWATSITTTAPGGDPLTGYQATAPTPAFAHGDRIRGHVMFKQGFTIASGATVTWDADGIVNGPITFAGNSSTLSLANDLRLGTTGGPIATVNAGKISGNGRSIIMGNNATLTKQVVVTSDLIVDGQGKTITLQNTNFSINEGVTLTLKNLTLVNNDSTPTATIFQGVGHCVFENVLLRCVPYSGTVAKLFAMADIDRNITFRGRVAFDAPGVLIVLLSTGAVGNYGVATFTIDKNSTFYIGQGTELRKGDTATVSFVMTDATSVFHFDGCDLYTGATTGDTNIDYATVGLTLTKGTVLFENKVRIFNKHYGGSTNTSMTDALNFGDGSSAANNVDVRVLGGAYVIVDGCMRYNAA